MIGTDKITWRFWRRNMNPSLGFLVCGLEHSGTTMVSDIFREHPKADSGFECGVLLCKTPSEFLTFEPFCKHMYVGWGIDHDDLSYACSARSFQKFYQRLFERSKSIKEKSSSIIFDKTPRYITHLSQVQKRLNRPVIAVIKDPRSLALSDYKRSKCPLEEIHSWYEEWKNPKMAYMRSAYEGYHHAWNTKNCHVVRLEDLCFNANSTVKDMFEFVGLEFKNEYLNLRNKRFGNTSGSSINVGSCMAFMDGLPGQIQERICSDFSEFDQWFYPF
jgi:hypothetical protein